LPESAILSETFCCLKQLFFQRHSVAWSRYSFRDILLPEADVLSETFCCGHSFIALRLSENSSKRNTWIRDMLLAYSCSHYTLYKINNIVMPILLAATIQFVHIEQVSALFTFRLGQVVTF
jgi:hypothetical protein